MRENLNYVNLIFSLSIIFFNRFCMFGVGRSLPQGDPDERDGAVRLGDHQEPAQVHDPGGAGGQLSVGGAWRRVGLLLAQEASVRADERYCPGATVRHSLRPRGGRLSGAKRATPAHGRLQGTF
jgi:hypothetical protein